MKKLFKLLALLAFGAGVTWLLRDQLVPGPTSPTAHPPPFRNPPEPPRPAAPPARSTIADPPDDLTAVKGIGPVYARKLTDFGITTFAALAAADADGVAAATGISADRLADWITKAAELA